MKRFLYLAFAISLLQPLAGSAPGSEQSLDCWHATRWAAAGISPSPKYAPDREVQMLHLALDVTPDFKARTVSGTAVLRFKAVAKPVQQVKLDAVELDVRSVTSSQTLQDYQVTGEQIILTFAVALPADHEATVTVKYSAEPKEGLYFRTPEMGYKPGDTHLFSQGEEIQARHWYPCLDSPNQRFTSELTCRVPEGMTAISNGRLLSEEKDAATGLVAFHWLQDKPHANYLISLVAGNFAKLEDRCRNVPLAFYTPASEINEARNSFRDTKDMMAFFEEEIGVPYPWDKYYQVCVNDFVAGGMENTSATTLTDRTLFTDATENIRTSQGLVAHELAHQWFGDLVTCKDWSHIWLNEGFATFYECLYDEHKNGRDALLYRMYQGSRSITAMTNDFNPIVRRNYETPGDMFGYLSYTKAGWVLHMLRAELGPELFRRCIKTYLERHQYGNVVTDDLRKVLEELSGRSFDRFFDQWLYHGGFPELDVNYQWDELARLAKVSIRQTQQVNDKVMLFNFPLTLRFKGKFGKVDRSIQVTQKEEDFYFPLASAPDVVRLDPDCTILARTKFKVPAAMLQAQLEDKSDVVGRLLAIAQWQETGGKKAVAALKLTLNHDGFYGARIEASKALRALRTEEALQALRDSTEQPDARVRKQVAEDLGGFYDQRALEAAQKLLRTEKNPEIRIAALRDLAGYAKPEVHALLLEALNSESYRNELADGAVAAIRLQDDPAYIPALLEVLSKKETAFTSKGFAQGLTTMAYLARNEEKKEAVREFLLPLVNHKKQTIKLAAISALGTLGDPKALAVLEPFTGMTKESPERAAAEKAVSELRSGRKPVDDFKNLREEVLNLQKANRELRKELDELKKRVEASTSAPSAPKARVRSPKAKN